MTVLNQPYEVLEITSNSGSLLSRQKMETFNVLYKNRNVPIQNLGKKFYTRSNYKLNHIW